jgi:hypothetical protein
MPEVQPQEWDSLLSQYPDAHLLQTSAWGQLKSGFGWQAAQVIGRDGPFAASGPPVELAGAQVLFRRLPLGLTLAYIPKGPVGAVGAGNVGAGLRPAPTGPSCWERLWPEVDAVCRKRRAVFLKVEPDLW